MRNKQMRDNSSVPLFAMRRILRTTSREVYTLPISARPTTMGDTKRFTSSVLEASQLSGLLAIFNVIDMLH
jgi:hypothetical protein